MDALDDVLERHRAFLTDGSLTDVLPLLGGVFPALSTGTTPPMSSDRTDHYHVFRAVRRLLERLSGLASLMLAFDDVQWAEPHTLNLLGHLLRHPPDGDIMVVVSHRPRQSQPELREFLEQSVVAGVTWRWSLDPAPADGAVPDAAPAGERPAARAPLLSLCSREFRWLSEDGQVAVRAAAVLDEPFEPSQLGAVAEFDDVQMRSALDELTAANLVVADESVRRLRFAHPLLRAGAYQLANPGWLLGAHARAAAFLTERGENGVRLAGHLERSALVGDEESARILSAAAREQLWRDPGQAAAWALAALDIRANASADVTAADRLVLAKAFVLSGRLSRGVQLFTEMATAGVPDAVDPSAEEGAGLLRVETAWWHARLMRMLGLFSAARSALDGVPQPPGDDASLMLAHGRVALALSTGVPADETDLATLRAIGGRATPVARAAVRALLAAADPEEAPAGEPSVAYLARGLGRAGGRPCMEQLEALHWLAWSEARSGRLGAAVEHAEHGLSIVERNGLQGLIPDFALQAGDLRLALGDQAAARHHAARARRAAARMESRHLLVRVDDLDRRAGLAPSATSSTVAGPPEPEGHPSEDLDALSRREHEIATLVSHGCTNYQIARRLGLSHKTVETYLGRIFKKLIVSSRAEVATMVGRAGKALDAGPQLAYGPDPGG